MHFEQIPSEELTFIVRNGGILESEIDGNEYQKLVVMLMHGDDMLMGTWDCFPMHQAEHLVENKLPLSVLIDTFWFNFETSGASYGLNFWLDETSGDEPCASIYPMYDEPNGENHIDTSELIHKITNIKIEL